MFIISSCLTGRFKYLTEKFNYVEAYVLRVCAKAHRPVALSSVVLVPCGLPAAGILHLLPRPVVISILLVDRLDVCLAVWVEQFLAAFLPRTFHFGRGNVPIRPAFPGDSAQVLTQVLHRRPSKEPVPTVDLVDDEIRLKNNNVRDHWIVQRIRIFGDVEILLHNTTRVGQKGPVCADSATVFIRLREVIRADGDKSAIAYFHFTV